MAKFVHLIRLKVELVFTEVENDENFNNYINSHYGSIQSLKSCQNLKYLKLETLLIRFYLIDIIFS